MCPTIAFILRSAVVTDKNDDNLIVSCDIGSARFGANRQSPHATPGARWRLFVFILVVCGKLLLPPRRRCRVSVLRARTRAPTGHHNAVSLNLDPVKKRTNV